MQGEWQRLKSYQKFAAMIERHWDGIAAYCRPENKVSLGFVEGLNGKIRLVDHTEEHLEADAGASPKAARIRAGLFRGRGG